MNNVIFNKTVTKLFNILKKCFLPNMNPTSYLIILHNFHSLNIYEYSEYHQHQYFHNHQKYHIHIHLVQFSSYYHLKNLLQCLPNTLDNKLIQNLLLWIYRFLLH